MENNILVLDLFTRTAGVPKECSKLAKGKRQSTRKKLTTFPVNQSL
jgi:hypothetical protein